MEEKLQHKNIDSPDEERAFDKGRIVTVTLGDLTVSQSTFDPGWRWSECVKPIAGTDSCQFHHKVFVLSGRLGIRMDHGFEAELGAGDVGHIPAGHDGWVIGDEPCIVIDFDESSKDYAKPA